MTGPEKPQESSHTPYDPQFEQKAVQSFEAGLAERYSRFDARSKGEEAERKQANAQGIPYRSDRWAVYRKELEDLEDRALRQFGIKSEEDPDGNRQVTFDTGEGQGPTTVGIKEVELSDDGQRLVARLIGHEPIPLSQLAGWQLGSPTITHPQANPPIKNPGVADISSNLRLPDPKDLFIPGLVDLQGNPLGSSVSGGGTTDKEGGSGADLPTVPLVSPGGGEEPEYPEGATMRVPTPGSALEEKLRAEKNIKENILPRIEKLKQQLGMGPYAEEARRKFHEARRRTEHPELPSHGQLLRDFKTTLPKITRLLNASKNNQGRYDIFKGRMYELYRETLESVQLTVEGTGEEGEPDTLRIDKGYGRGQEVAELIGLTPGIVHGHEELVAHIRINGRLRNVSLDTLRRWQRPIVGQEKISDDMISHSKDYLKWFVTRPPRSVRSKGGRQMLAGGLPRRHDGEEPPAWVNGVDWYTSKVTADLGNDDFVPVPNAHSAVERRNLRPEALARRLRRARDNGDYRYHIGETRQAFEQRRNTIELELLKRARIPLREVRHDDGTVAHMTRVYRGDEAIDVEVLHHMRVYQDVDGVEHVFAEIFSEAYGWDEVTLEALRDLTQSPEAADEPSVQEEEDPPRVGRTDAELLQVVGRLEPGSVNKLRGTLTLNRAGALAAREVLGDSTRDLLKIPKSRLN